MMNSDMNNATLQTCAHCLKAFKRIKTHRCKVVVEGAKQTIANQHGILPQTPVVVPASQPPVSPELTVFLTTWCAEQAEQRKLEREKMAEERKKREEDMEKHKADMEKHKKEREQDMEKHKADMEKHKKEMEQDMEKHKEEMRQKELNRKHQLELADKFIQNSKDLTRMEIEAQERFYTARWDHEREINNQYTRISICEPALHSAYEMPVYGTRSTPAFLTSDVKAYVSRHILPPLTDHETSTNCERTVSQYKTLSDTVFKTIDAMSEPHTYSEGVEEKTGDFVEMESLDTYFHRLETTTSKRKDDDRERTIVSMEFLQAKLKSTHRSLPFSPFQKGDHKIHQFRAEIEKINSTFRKNKLNIRKENILYPTHLIPSDDGEISATEEPIRYGTTLATPSKESEQVVGSHQQTPSAFKRLRQLEDDSVHQLRKFFSIWVDETDRHPVKRIPKQVFVDNLKRLTNTIRNGLGTLRAFLISVKDQLSSRTGYLPLFVEQSLQDQRFKKIQETLPPENRQSVMLSKRDLSASVRVEELYCSTCKVRLDDHNLSRGHITPRQGGKFGTDYPHNIQPQCIACNTRLGNMHMMLHPQYSFPPVVEDKLLKS